MIDLLLLTSVIALVAVGLVVLVLGARHTRVGHRLERDLRSFRGTTSLASRRSSPAAGVRRAA